MVSSTVRVSSARAVSVAAGAGASEEASPHPASAPAFGKHVVVRIEPGLDEHGANPKARIELLNTTIQRCAEFYVDDVRQSEGLWGSAAAAAANPGLRVHTAPFFTGTGLMQVYSGVGVTLIIR